MAYTILLIPVTIARFVAFGGHDVPFRATIFADFVFNLQGLANVALLLLTRRCVPDTETLPLFAPRKHVSMSSPEAFGITPFVLPAPAGKAEDEEKVDVEGDRTDAAQAQNRGAFEAERPLLTRQDSASSFGSVDSQTPFVLHIR